MPRSYHKIKTPAPRNRATLNTSGAPVTKPVQTPVTAPNTQATNLATFSDEGAAVSQVQSTAVPDQGYDDRPLDQVDTGQVPQYVYVTSAPLVAVGNPRI